MLRCALVVLFLPVLASAAPPETSIRPEARQSVVLQTTAEPEASQSAPATSVRPGNRPRRVERAGRVASKLRAEGSICRDADIQGDVLGRVTSRVVGCGIDEAVGVRAVAGVTLSPRATMDCTTAAALKEWVEGSVKPTFSKMGGGVVSLRVAGHYACRRRNNRSSGRISEHGKGRAIDISEFRLQDGTSVSVLKGWHAASTRGAIREVHRAACGPFGTVLGPNSDRYHQDHFHFDTARYRSGPYCR